MGRVNNIARSLIANISPAAAISTLLKGQYQKIDTATVGGQLCLGSAGFGFVPEIASLVCAGNAIPRFAYSWAQLGARAAANVRVAKTVIKIDAFRFDLKPIMVHVNLLPYAAGLPLTPMSMTDDGQAEIVFDFQNQIGDFSSFTRSIYKKKYFYGDDIRIYRGREIVIHPVQGRKLYLDGEIQELQVEAVEVHMSDQQLKVFR
jgi:diacylglycerol kinase family enzyme